MQHVMPWVYELKTFCSNLRLLKTCRNPGMSWLVIMFSWLSCVFRIAYLGLTLGLRTASFFLCFLGLVVLRRHVQRQERNTLANGGTGAAAGELQALRKEENNSCNSDQCPQTADYDPERETRLWRLRREQQGRDAPSVPHFLSDSCKWCEISCFWYSRFISWMYVMFWVKKEEEECLTNYLTHLDLT